MENKHITKPLILVSNDDGVEAEGIVKLAEMLCDLGEVVVFAPDGGALVHV